MKMYCVVAVLLVVKCSSACADHWPQWRGPNQNGTASAGDFAVDWSPNDNIDWQIDLPGKAGSTPIVWDGRIVLTASAAGHNIVLCLNRKGETVWKTNVGQERVGKHRKASGANPSPVTDGENIYVYFKSGDFAALDFSGTILWQQNLQEMFGEDTLWWDLGTSPALTSQHVVVACMQSPPSPSYLAAFDKQTGKQAWYVERELGAPEEAAQSYSTPMVTTFGGQEQLVVLGADHVTCHAAETGQELWRVGGMNPTQERFFRSIASPVISGDIVIAPYARGKTLTAIRLGGSGDVTASHVLWVKEGLSSDVPTPAAQDGRVYVCTDKGKLGCLDAESGEELWTLAMEKHRTAFSSSPVVVDDRVYLTREDARTFVVDTHTHELVSSNPLQEDEFIVSTPVFVDGEILIRTFERLYCIQPKRRSVSSN